jgi:hypothetical protein
VIVAAAGELGFCKLAHAGRSLLLFVVWESFRWFLVIW